MEVADEEPDSSAGITRLIREPRFALGHVVCRVWYVKFKSQHALCGFAMSASTTGNKICQCWATEVLDVATGKFLFRIADKLLSIFNPVLGR